MGGKDLSSDGRVRVTDDGFRYVELSKDWQDCKGRLAEAAASWCMDTNTELLAADKAALEKRLPPCDGTSEYSWGFWDPPSHVGLHISLGKHSNNVKVGNRVRFRVKRILHFRTRKLGASSSSDSLTMFCARWFTFEVRLVDEVHCEGEEPHISFAVFGARSPAAP